MLKFGPDGYLYIGMGDGGSGGAGLSLTRSRGPARPYRLRFASAISRSPSSTPRAVSEIGSFKSSPATSTL